MERKYRQVSCERFSGSDYVHTAYEKAVGCFVFRLDDHDDKRADEMFLEIKKGDVGIGFIKTAYFYDKKVLFIQDMSTHHDYIRIGLGRTRLEEILSFLNSKGETPKTIIAEGVGYLGIPHGEEFVKALGFQHVGNRDSWQVSFEELSKRLQKK